MGSFETVGSELISLSLSILRLGQQKTEFAKSINYQVSQFFELLGCVSAREDIVKIEENSLTRPLDKKLLGLLINLSSRSQAYLTPEDICDYLHISRHSARRSGGEQEVKDDAVQQFYLLLEEEHLIQCRLRETLRETNLESWFGEVDFFANGYIDTSALYQFLLHYGSSPIQEYNALVLIRVIKQHSHSDKMFIQDIKDFLEGEQGPQQPAHPQDQPSPLDSPYRGMMSQGETEQLLISPSKHRSQELISLCNFESSASFLSKSNIIASPLSGPSNNLAEHLRFPEGRSLAFQLQEKDACDKRTYEEKLIALHPRNQKYILQVRSQMEGVVPLCRLEVQSHLMQLALRATQQQLLDRLQLLGSLYNRKSYQIRRLIGQEPKFTFLNAYELLDNKQGNQICLQEWLDFLQANRVTTTSKRAVLFFHSLATRQTLTFSCFLKIFKVEACREDYQRCERRCSLIYESWTPSLLHRFCSFLGSMMRIKEEEDSLLQELGERREQIKQLREDSSEEQMSDLLGHEYRSFLREFFSSELM